MEAVFYLRALDQLQSPFSYLPVLLGNIRLSIGGRPRGVSKSSRRKTNCRESIMLDLKSLVMILFSLEDIVKASDLPCSLAKGRCPGRQLSLPVPQGSEPNPTGTPKEPFPSTCISLRGTEYQPLRFHGLFFSPGGSWASSQKSFQLMD